TFAGAEAQAGLWFTLLVVAVGAAVNEELFCRGFLGNGLVGRYGVLVGVVITSVIFGVIHGNVPQGVWACMLGCFLHLAYLATRSLWVPMLLHFLNSAAATLVGAALLGLDLQWYHLLAFAATVILVTIPSAWMLYRLRARPTVAPAAA